MKNPTTRLSILFVLLGASIFAARNCEAGILLRADSSGWLTSGANHAWIYVDGIEYAGNDYGINVVVVDQNTGSVLGGDAFTGWGDYQNNAAAARAEFAQYIAAIDIGRIVMIAVRDDAMASWIFPGDYRGDLSNVLHSIGGSATNMTDIGFRGSYALIGTKGGAVGSGIEAKGTVTGIPVSVSRTLDINPPPAIVPEPNSFAIFALGATMIGLGPFRRRKHLASSI